jgi:hypothetical protein
MRITVKMIKRKYNIAPVICPVVGLKAIFQPLRFVNGITYVVVNDYGKNAIGNNPIVAKNVSGNVFYGSLFQS